MTNNRDLSQQNALRMRKISILNCQQVPSGHRSQHPPSWIKRAPHASLHRWQLPLITFFKSIFDDTALDRFQKDFAAAERENRQQELERRKAQIQSRRIRQLERESKRWERIENSYNQMEKKREREIEKYKLGIRRTAHSNGLAFNPINLEYDKNPEGQKLKYRDEEDRIRGFVRAHNMEKNGNSQYNILNGQDRIGVERVVPSQLMNRYEKKLFEHEDSLRIKLPPMTTETIARRRAQGQVGV